jgi:hypothetical protein
METTYHFVDLAKYPKALSGARPGYIEELPKDLFAKDAAAKWHSAYSPIAMDKPIDWRYCIQGTHVMIPLFPYRLAAVPEAALGYMLQLGLRCGLSIAPEQVQRLHLAIGQPVQQVCDGDETYWQFWAGVGLLFK